MEIEATKIKPLLKKLSTVNKEVVLLDGEFIVTSPAKCGYFKTKLNESKGDYCFDAQLVSKALPSKGTFNFEFKEDVLEIRNDRYNLNVPLIDDKDWFRRAIQQKGNYVEFVIDVREFKEMIDRIEIFSPSIRFTAKEGILKVSSEKEELTETIPCKGSTEEVGYIIQNIRDLLLEDKEVKIQLYEGRPIFILGENSSAILAPLIKNE